jgi:hypothetical protein
MGLTKKERKELIKEINHKYKDKKGRYSKGVTLGDISDDMHHSDRREIADVSDEMVKHNSLAIEQAWENKTT